MPGNLTLDSRKVFSDILAFWRWFFSLIIISSILSGCSNNARTGQSIVEGSDDPQNNLQSPTVIPGAAAESPTVTQSSIPVLPSTVDTLALVEVTPSPVLSKPYANKRVTEETPVPSCLIRGGRVILSSLSTSLIPLPLEYRVYLPPCYRQNPEQRYPLLILIHGQSYTDDQWDRLGVDETIDRLVLSGELPPFIVLMPRDRYGGESNENNFARVVVEQLLPVIDEEYRTRPGRQYRAVGGLSRGAGWAVHIGMTYWQEFSLIGAHSPAIFYTDAQKMRTWLDAIPEEQLPQVFVDVGERDRPEILDSAYWFADLLDEKGVVHAWYLFSGFHNEEYWSSHLEKYLRWYAQNW